jgi:hypothetical protein
LSSYLPSKPLWMKLCMYVNYFASFVWVWSMVYMDDINYKTAQKMIMFWVVTPYRLVGRYQRFGGTYCLNLQADVIMLGSETLATLAPLSLSLFGDCWLRPFSPHSPSLIGPLPVACPSSGTAITPLPNIATSVLKICLPQNVGTYLQVHTASQPRTSSPPWEPQILHAQENIYRRLTNLS